MICNKCGTVLPDNAEFCGECGAKVEKKKKAPAALEKARTEAKRYKVLSIILAAMCVVLGVGWMVSSHDPYDNLDNYERDVVSMERAGVELTGTYVVGEDSELPQGRYNIYPPDNESYLSVDIYNNLEDAQKKDDKDYNSYAIDHLYSLARGYKLKAGQVVVIEYDSAYFELVSEDTPETEPPQTEEETDATQPAESEPASE